MKNEKSTSLLLNPFVRIAGWKAFIVGSAIVCVTIIIGYFSNVWYPGVLDIKLATDFSLLQAFIVQIISLFYLSFVMYPASRLFSKKTRFQDLLGTTVLARFPFLLASLLGFIIKPESINGLVAALKVGEFTFTNYLDIIVASIMMIPIIIWYVILLFNAFKVSSNIKGIKATVIFAVCLILAEIISSILNWTLLKYVLIGM